MDRTLVRLWKLPDGTIGRWRPCWDDHVNGFDVLKARDPNLTEEEFYEWAVTLRIPADWVSLGDVPSASLPTREYRDAWRHDGAKVTVDMPMARTIHLNKIRACRKPELERLDVEWMKAMGQKRTAEADAIEAQRQALRDLPAILNVAACTTPDELKAIWPEQLPKTGA